MTNTIGGDAREKKRKCLACLKPFQWPEFLAYFVKFRGNSVSCVRCLKKYYIVPKMSLLYVLMKLISFVVGMGLFVCIFIMIPMASYNAEQGSFVVSGLFLMIGVAVGFLVGTNIMRLYNWKMGVLSDDEIHESYWDM